MDETIVITAQDIVNHTVYSRKKNELSFQLEFLKRHGATEEDLHMKALLGQMSQLSERLSPIEEKLATVDLVTIVPSREKIDGLNGEINSYAQEERDKAVTERAGGAYEKMKERACLTRKNYDNREEIARLTLLANSLSREEAGGIKKMVECEGSASVGLAGVDGDKKLEILVLLNRLGVPAAIEGDSIVRASSESAWEVERVYENDKKIWIEKEKSEEFDKNEKSLVEINRKLQRLNAIKQARSLEGEEHDEFIAAQNSYLEATDRRKGFLKDARKGLARLELKRHEQKLSAVMDEIASERDISAKAENSAIRDEVKEAVSEMLSEKTEITE